MHGECTVSCSVLKNPPPQLAVWSKGHLYLDANSIEFDGTYSQEDVYTARFLLYHHILLAPPKVTWLLLYMKFSVRTSLPLSCHHSSFKPVFIKFTFGWPCSHQKQSQDIQYLPVFAHIYPCYSCFPHLSQSLVVCRAEMINVQWHKACTKPSKIMAQAWMEASEALKEVKYIKGIVENKS